MVIIYFQCCQHSKEGLPYMDISNFIW